MRHALILAGGIGTRFWPRSRKDHPKQVLHVVGHKSLIQETLERLEGAIPPSRTHVITSEMQYGGLASHIGKSAVAILEPFGRDTAASIGLGTEKIFHADPKAVIATLPADHHITPKPMFHRALQTAMERVEKEGGLLLFGVSPTRPATSYGYIRRGTEISPGLFGVEGFVEKPDAARAQALIDSGDHYWNSGMFVWRAKDILKAIREEHAELGAALDRIRKALGTPKEEVVIREAFTSLPSISIDYAVLEKAEGLVVREANFEWDDVGSWLALERLHRTNDQGNVVIGRHVSLDSRGLVVVGGQRLVATIGVEDLIIVESRDAILIARKDRAEEVKALVKRIESEGLEAYL
ncbi:MAG: sugar phosphate nucleotidyltransferase [Planctomycetota bacterium]|nr:sugar phosphate nucleotidyltransferase [Planctomycetota bacterium]